MRPNKSHLRPSWNLTIGYLTIPLSLFWAAAFPILARASEPPEAQLVADLEVEAARISSFRGFHTITDDGRAFYQSDDGVRGPALWVTDGTAGGTRLWADVCPGRCEVDESALILGGVAFDGGRSVFVANDGIHGAELWSGDGTPEGTRLVIDLCPGDCHSEISGLYRHGDLVFFQRPVYRQVSFYVERIEEAWVTDGTAAGTRSLRGTGPGPLYPSFRSYVPLGDGVAFLASDEDSASPEWWQSDGTPEGTRRVTDLCDGSCYLSSPGSLDDLVVFPICYETREELWSLRDGGATERLAVLSSEGCDRFITIYRRFGGKLWLSHQTRLWSTDGTPGATAPALELPPGERRISALEEVAGQLLVATEPTSFESRLWRLDSSALTGPLLEVGGHLEVVSLGETAVVTNFIGPPFLWRTDGTVDGTVAVETAIDSPYNPLSLGEQAVFASGSVLWTTDGSTAGTMRLEEARSLRADASPEDLRAVGSKVVFAAEVRDPEDPYSYQSLWVSDGSAGGTELLAAKVFPQELSAHTLAGRPVATFVGLDDEAGREPWITDGTVAGTFPLGDLEPYFGNSHAREPVTFGDRIAFLADSGTGQKIWLTNGTPKGTVPFVDIDPEWYNNHYGCSASKCTPPIPPGPIFPHDLKVLGTASGERLVFVARQEETGAELWTSDGTESGTALLIDLRPGASGSEPEWLTVVPVEGRSDLLFFTADTDGHVLWVTDGTAEGTRRLAAVAEVLDTAAVGGRLAWLERQADGSERLRASDGTPGGLGPGIDLPPKAVSGGRLVAAGPRIYLTVADEAGAELWKSDLTAAGTSRVADLWPGHRGSAPEELRVIYGRLHFTADDGVHGRELWRLDGGVPQRLTDVWPGPEPSSPNDVTAAGDLLFFGADDGLHGRELWALPRSEADDPYGCVDGTSAFCLGGVKKPAK